MVWVVLISLCSSVLLASIQRWRSGPARQERMVMGRPEVSRLRVGGAVEAGGVVMDGRVYVGGGIMTPPAEVGDGVVVEEAEAEEMTQWATSVTEDQ